MVVFPNAKINLGLNVTEKRSDGFHNIETVFYPIKLCDILEIVKSQNKVSTLFNSGIIINDNIHNNLCMKALNLIKKDFYLPEVDVFLHKVIPFGAGLGGGSADAANVLIVLNKMFNLNINSDKLMQYAAELGSDCAFFIKNKPQLASGRGEIMHDIDVDLKGYYFVLIKPNVFVGTAQAYADIKPEQPKIRIAEIMSKPVNEWKYFLKNDFETTVFEQFPVIKTIKETLYQRGAVYSAMSGSGSSVYGIFDKKTDVSDFEKDCFVFTDYFTDMS
ncbi:MAG: 4-(cytidine 5'-diphospho)-2-C-methyl-D-erythritol kinase [Prevotellaceae bacterium]|jgi:4-diphosphocytidyl-2-C-methyl-D-erythritol kinase|nr:4-(cytidine 5'-diphospho)-2-C-methyl-D-erythritol kinase [Prevotellaceae bacterium]